jgi:signal transduction histidine kinase
VFDVLVVGVSLVGGITTLLTTAEPPLDTLSPFTIGLDLVLGVAASFSLLARRRAPMVVAAVAVVATAFAVSPGIAMIIALYGVAFRRTLRDAIVVACGSLVATVVLGLQRPDGQSFAAQYLVGALVYAALIGWGVYARTRESLLATLHERAERAESEQGLLAEQARAAERTLIAREMHDALGHRISLLALHAGGLEVRPDRPPEEIAETGRLLSTTARQALEDLRSVIGVLRSDGTVDAPTNRLPGFDDLPRLADASRAAGARVDLALHVDPDVEVPVAVGRDSYRVVQEALTNVAKHAPDSAAIVDVRAAVDGGVAITVRNSLAPRAKAGSAGADVGGGAGLIGLAERVELAGGVFSAGPKGKEFVVEARLPW